MNTPTRSVMLEGAPKRADSTNGNIHSINDTSEHSTDLAVEVLCMNVAFQANAIGQAMPRMCEERNP
jgi:hypothetical protein